MQESENLFNKGKAEYFRGNLERAADLFEQSMTCQPDSHVSNSNLLLALNYRPDQAQESLFRLHTEIGKHYCQPISALTSQQLNPQESKRRIRIGYVSPDFRLHSVAFFIAPVLMKHDREFFEIFSYYNHKTKDAGTAGFRACCDHWRDIADMTDRQVADLIKSDGIDILIDLAGHSAKNRLLTFAHKPAPVQVTWLGYPNTTGLPTMDYRLTDEGVDPTGSSDLFHSEKLIRLPKTFLCYSPLRQFPDPSPLPAIRNKFITFGSLNNFAKINSRVVLLWIRLLKEIPDSRLVMIFNGDKSWLDNSIHEARSSKEIPFAVLRSMTNFLFAKTAFKNNDIAPERITILSRSATDTIHHKRYQDIDIALDPFPYNGTTTTFESFWMGVPVISLRGNRHAARVSAGISVNLGLEELSGDSEDAYISAASRLAADKDKLASLRASLRSIMSTSCVMDAEEFTRNLESAYRTMWKDWCRKEGR